MVLSGPARRIVLCTLLVVGALILLIIVNLRTQASVPVDPSSVAAPPGSYVVLAWNDLGMHCYNPSFQDLAVLPPYNTLWAQVIRVGSPPQIITQGITLTYSINDNTYSVGKTDFWTYAQQLYGAALAPNIGLTGRGLSGAMSVSESHFVAEGIPLTEYRDSAPTTPYPYQLATIIVHDAATGVELARQEAVAPVSTEMRCDFCHADGGVDDIATGRVETNILTLHDREHLDDYPAGHEGALMGRRPVNCAECHATNALGAPGVAGIPNLSRAMHGKHAGEAEDMPAGCYSCHPGPQTQCLRDVMATEHGMTCTNCHGTLAQVAQNPNPWLNEPRCDNALCHGAAFAQDDALYRNSTEHAEIYCEGCHDSTHAIAPSSQPSDGLKFMALQGQPGPLRKCSVCHATRPTGAGPHGLTAPIEPTVTPTRDPNITVTPRAYLPLILK